MIARQGGKADVYRTPLAAAIHETAVGLHRVGLMDKATMCEFDASCLVEPVSAREIVIDRKRAGVRRKDPL
jgi:putative transcriptional regulator